MREKIFKRKYVGRAVVAVIFSVIFFSSLPTDVAGQLAVVTEPVAGVELIGGSVSVIKAKTLAGLSLDITLRRVTERGSISAFSLGTAKADNNGNVSFEWTVPNMTFATNYFIQVDGKMNTPGGSSFSARSGEFSILAPAGYECPAGATLVSGICQKTVECIVYPGRTDCIPVYEKPETSNLYAKTCPDASEPLCPSRLTRSDVGVTLYGVGGPDMTINPKLPTTGYFRYSSQSKPPIFCNDIYGTAMRSTEDRDLGSDNGPTRFSQVITGLRPDTTYYYCAVVSNKKHIVYGGVGEFHTDPLHPSIETKEARVMSSTSAYLNSSYSSGQSMRTYFEYRKKPRVASTQEDNVSDYYQNMNWITAGVKNHLLGSGQTNVYGKDSFLLSGLSPSTLYEFRAAGSTDNRVVSGDILRFTTKASTEAPCYLSGTCPPPTCEQLNTCDSLCFDPFEYDYDTRTCRYMGEETPGGGDGSSVPDLVASAILSGTSIVNQSSTYQANITNLGGVQAGGTEQIKYLTHSFQINDENKMFQDEDTTIENVVGGGIKAGSTQTIEISHTFASVGIKRIRACAHILSDDRNPNNNCGPWTAIWVAYPAPDLVAGPIETLTMLGGEFSEFIATVDNIGALSTATSFQNLFQYDKDTDHDSGVYGFGGSSAGPLASGASASINASNDFPAGIWNIRACADKVNSEDQYGTIDEGPDRAGEENNCGPWTRVAATCEAPAYYDSGEDECVTPVTCDADTEIYNYSSGSCVTKEICEESETYNSSTNTCIPPVDCEANPEHYLCREPQPGEWDPFNMKWVTLGVMSGEWTAGGWFDGTWYGGEWIGKRGKWRGGTWRNGVWSGGYWISDTSDSGGASLTVGQRATPPWDAIVRYHEGVEHVFQRQIVNRPEIREKFGYAPGMDLYTFSWDTAHLLAQIFGYIDADGREIRVSYPDIAAYELRLTGDRLTIYEYYDGIVVSIQNITTMFKDKAGYEYYFKK